MIYPKNRPNQTCGYWLITPNQQTLCIEIVIEFVITLNSGQLQISERRITKQWAIKNNPVNGAVLITMNCLIILVISQSLDKG